jgi:hypothetical protein
MITLFEKEVDFSIDTFLHEIRQKSRKKEWKNDKFQLKRVIF